MRRIRGGGSISDGIHVLHELSIDDLDYDLMGSDNACAKISFGDSAITGKWFAINRRSDLARQWLGNSHGVSDDGGKTFRVETAYLEVPKADCLVEVDEVVWHHLRVAELREAGVERPERVRIMNEERAGKPWDGAR